MAFGNSQSPKKFRWWHVTVIVVILIATIGVALSSRYYPKALVKINNTEYQVLVADTPEHWYKGLSDRPNLGKYDGMLFIFGEESDHSMVMRRMEFPLDIIWLNQGKIVDMAPNLPPDPSTIEANLVVYAARAPSDMVLELPAGSIEKNGLRVGDMVLVAR